ncbi:MAG: hypothetical protein ABI467_02345 [Kofleriaceae bacterium]
MVRAWLLVALAGATAAARPTRRKPKPPSRSELAALQLATSWVDKLGHAAAEARPLTASRFTALALTDETTACPQTATAGPGLTCLHDKVSPTGKAAVWGHTLGGPLAAHQTSIDHLARGAIVVQFDEGCDGTENQVLVIVKGKQVIAAFAQTISCSE